MEFTDKQRRLLQHVFDYFKRQYCWPRSRQVELEVRQWATFWDLTESIDWRYLVPGDRYSSNSIVRLSALGIAQCENHDEMLETFVRVLRICVEWYIKTTSAGQESILPRFKFTELTGLGLNSGNAALLLITGESRLLESWSGDQFGNITSIRLSPDVLRFEGVTEITNYLDVLKKEHEGQARRTRELQSLLNQAAPQVLSSWTSETKEMIQRTVFREEHRQAVLQDINELESALANGNHKSACILCGSVCEAILLDRIVAADESASDRKSFSQMIQIAINTNQIDPRIGKLLDYVRDKRNLVHPERASKEGTATRTDALVSYALMAAVCQSVFENLSP